MKSDLLDKTINLLKSRGYVVSDCRGIRSSFDILAKKKLLLVIKAIINIESLTKESAAELKKIADLISAVPLIIGDHMKSSRLMDGVIYSRYNINVVNLETFGNILSDKAPLIYSIRGNYCIHINPKQLVGIRKELSMTQEELASKIGISKQSIHRYENFGRMSLKIAEKLMDFLRDDISVSPDFFISIQPEDIPDYGRDYETRHKSITDMKRGVVRSFKKMGFSTSLTNAPFDIVAKESETIYTVVSDDGRRLKLKVEKIKEISDIVGGYSICISNRKQDLDSLILKPSEFIGIKEAEELFDLLSQY